MRQSQVRLIQKNEKRRQQRYSRRVEQKHNIIKMEMQIFAVVVLVGLVAMTQGEDTGKNNKILHIIRAREVCYPQL